MKGNCFGISDGGGDGDGDGDGYDDGSCRLRRVHDDAAAMVTEDGARSGRYTKCDRGVNGDYDGRWAGHNDDGRACSRDVGMVAIMTVIA